MRRRRFLRTGAGLTAVALAGCAGADAPQTDAATDDRPATESPTATPSRTPTPTPDGPEGVYVQSFRETMAMPGTAVDGDYAVALLLTIPHRFWEVTGTERTAHPIEDRHDGHLMATVWDPETGTVLPESGLSVEVTRDGDLVSEEVIYPMLSQRMGFHYGGNFGLDGDGEYAAAISVGGVEARTTGAFDGRFEDGTTVEIDFEWTGEVRDGLRSEQLEQAGSRGALRPMDAEGVPQPRAPAPESLPGTHLGTGRVDDATLVAMDVPADEAPTDGEPYLAVSARTPFNGLVLPSMGLAATVGGDDPAFDGRLERTLDPTLGYHYGAALPERVGDADVTLTVETPPQVARHEGYERAFLESASVTL